MSRQCGVAKTGCDGVPEQVVSGSAVLGALGRGPSAPRVWVDTVFPCSLGTEGVGLACGRLAPSSAVFSARAWGRRHRGFGWTLFSRVRSVPREWDWPAGGCAVLGRLQRSRPEPCRRRLGWTPFAHVHSLPREWDWPAGGWRRPRPSSALAPGRERFRRDKFESHSLRSLTLSGGSVPPHRVLSDTIRYRK